MGATRTGCGRAGPTIRCPAAAKNGANRGLRSSAALRVALAVAAVFAIAAPLHAQPATVQPGVVERERKEAPPPKPADSITIPSVESPRTWDGADTIKFVLNSVDIDGNTALGDEELMRPFQSLVGTEVSLGQIFAAADAITQMYDAAGYALSLAYVPAQEVKGGAIVVRVVEGYIADVVFKDKREVRDPRWNEYAAHLKASRPLKSADLERYLLLAGDLPGIKVTNHFERMADAGPGATRLIMNIDRKAMGAQAELNNRGSKAIGPYRQSLNVDLHGVFGRDERLSFFGVTAITDNELGYFGARMDLPVGGEGAVLSMEASRSETDPGTAALSALDYEGEAWTGSGSVTYPFIRSLRENLYGSFGFTYKNMKSRILSSGNSHDKLTALAVGADYDSRDRWGGVWRAAGTLYTGVDILNATKKSDPLSSRAGASGRFFRLEGSVSRLTSLSNNASFYAELAGQIADRPLLVSEQCGYGGGYIGRAFDPFEISADNCVKGRAEFRFDFPLESSAIASLFQGIQFYALADFGVMIKDGDLLPLETRVETAESVGLGIRFRAFDFLSAFVEGVHPLDRGVALENGSKDSRFFFGISLTY